ncbi:hypothetical protein SBV1_110032 [Verrucomicrobia bacterium]|nr:hypothetical protein SBV1_110032 [Verrucomicrobiota bacterium]
MRQLPAVWRRSSGNARISQDVDVHGWRQQFKSTYVKQYIREISGGGFSAKDSRAWAAKIQPITAPGPTARLISAQAGGWVGVPRNPRALNARLIIPCLES